MSLDPEFREELEGLSKQYEQPAGGLLPIFHRIQEELGYIPDYAMSEASKITGVPEVLAYGVMSFYTLFDTKKQGEKVIFVCESFTCNLLESEKLLGELERVLKIKAGETTPDKKFTLRTVPCLGACDKAPVVMIDWEVYERVKKDEIAALLDKL